MLTAANRSSGLKHHYDDVRYLGKHFRITKKADPSFSRHYTISNVMTAHIMRAYLDCLKNNTSLPPYATESSD